MLNDKKHKEKEMSELLKDEETKSNIMAKKLIN